MKEKEQALSSANEGWAPGRADMKAGQPLTAKMVQQIIL